jgi:uncharacterized SAM-binding protein YcdF (DUF218 family)
MATLQIIEDKLRSAAPSSRLRRIFIHALRVSAVLAALLFAGFVVYAQAVSRSPAGQGAHADGIVALTGGEERIAEAVRLLAEGRAKRLLISGVNPSTSKLELIGLNPRSERLFRCCVDLDKRAIDTRDNALQTTAWARKQGFHSLIVVTSSYHMPRSLIELRQTMTDVELIPYAVKPPALQCDRWWSDRTTLFVLAKEYIKLVTAVSRYAAYRLFGGENTASATRVAHARVG